MDTSEYDKMYRLEESNWWYESRRDLVLNMVAQIEKKLSKKTLKILDTGCGTGINLKHLHFFGDAYGLDFSKDALKFSKNRELSSLICGSADRLPLKGNIYDLVLALDVLEHIEDDLYAVRELNRVLISQGYLIITVPAFQFLWSGHDLAVHHKRRYTRSGILGILRREGFEIDKATYWNFFLFLPVAVLRLFKRLALSEENVQTDLEELPSFINKFLKNVIRIENRLIDIIDLPFGISLVCVCRKVTDGKDETKWA